MATSPDLAVILAGAGEGLRMGALGPKLLVDIGGRPALARVAETFLAHPAVGELVAVVPKELEAAARRALDTTPNPRGVRVAIVPGGATRQDSVARGLDALQANLPYIAVHDVARVLVDAPLIDRVLAAARATGAAIPALPIADSVKEVAPSPSAGPVAGPGAGRGPGPIPGPTDNHIARSVPRHNLVAAQTPQLFASAILRKAYAHARETRATATDEAGLAEAIGVAVAVVAGDERNRKLTVPSDLIILNALLRAGAATESP